MSSLDLKLLRTLATLVRRPGELTLAYARGARSLYTRPVQLFLLINVAFFFAASPLGVFRYELPAAVTPSMLPATQFGRILQARMRESGASWDDTRERYNASVDRRKRELISLWVLAFGLAVAVLQLRRRRYLAEHLVFAVHFFTFVLLYLPLVIGLLRLVMRGDRSSAVNAVASVVLVALLVGGIVGHLTLALHRVYGGPAWASVARALLLVCGIVAFARVYAAAVHLLAASMV